ncbi:MAG: hypothetical protein RDV41_12620 [Planctomycetota bacterium]|nr:hypothetical protein [Planctomycetota bacterium]
MSHVCLAFCLALVSALLCVAVAHAQDAGPADRPGKFNVGFTILDFKYGDGDAEKTITVAVWYPTDAEPREYSYGGPAKGRVALDAEPRAEGGPFPFLAWSHGYGGGGTASVFFTESLAGHGWIVAAPDHGDRHTAIRSRIGPVKDFDKQALLRHATEISRSGPADREPYLYRVNELKIVLDGMTGSEKFGKLIDQDRTAVGGHSFGGFTSLGLCGALPDRKDERIKAVLVFSSGAAGYLYEDKELAAVKMPSMYFLGENEKETLRGDKTMAEIAGKVYGNMSPPKYFLEIQGASHFSFNNRFVDTPGSRLLSGTEEQFDVIRRYAIAFLEKHVAGKAEAGKTLDEKDPLLTRYAADAK